MSKEIKHCITGFASYLGASVIQITEKLEL
jgi:hypothetical protein